MANNKIIIGLIGEKGAGKGTVSDYLQEKYGAVHYGTSKILRRTLEDLHLPVTRDNLVKLALVLKEGYGPSVIIDSLIHDMEKKRIGYYHCRRNQDAWRRRTVSKKIRS